MSHYVFFLQALEVIRELQKHFPIKRSPMRLRLTVPGHAFSSVSEKLNEWKSSIVSKEESGNQLSVVRFFFFKAENCYSLTVKLDACKLFY